MKKNNWVFYGIAFIASVILLVVWFFMGFNHVDAPLDPILTVLWWILIVASCFAIDRVSKMHSDDEDEERDASARA